MNTTPMDSIARAVSSSIKESKWLSITYDSDRAGRDTCFWCAVKDIDPNSKILHVDLFNSTKSSDALLDKVIHYEKIKEAHVVEFSSFEPAYDLIAKIEGNIEKFAWLHYENFDNNILMYLEDCNKFDTDPFQKKYSMVEGIDLSVFAKNKKFTLSDQQVQDIVKLIYFNDLKRFDNANNELALSCLSIDQGGKKFVVAYYTVCFNPSLKSLVLVGGVHFNRTFLIDDVRHSLSHYIDMDNEEFIEGYRKDPETYKDLLKENLHGGEMIDTRPDLMILERDMVVNLTDLFETIAAKKEAGTLNVPLKAFFGDISRYNFRRKEPQIVIYNEKVDPDQMRVIYNAMKNPVTYVQGPPGTGKTQTLFNVLVSAYYSGKTTLVCSMNNKPVDGIIEKIVFKYHDKEIHFPYLRLGNQEETEKATSRIRFFVEHPLPGTPDLNKIDEIKKEAGEKTVGLVQLLKDYEARKEMADNLCCVEKVQKEAPKSASLAEEIEELKKKIDSMPLVDNAKILSLFSPAGADPRYQMYLYYSSVYHLNKLQLPEYADLRGIVSIPDASERVSQFNSWTKNDKNMKLLVDVFPLIFTTNISASRLGTGVFSFDLVIMDEAGQCDEAKSLIPIARGNSLLLVGDVDQLKPVIVLDPAVNEKLKEKYQISANYDYELNSILSTMQNADNISKRVLLSYHYRCGKRIISFSNQYFYSKSLKLDFANGDGVVCLDDVQNMKSSPLHNVCLEEAVAVANYVKANDLKDAVIITPFVNQAYVINELLKNEGIKDVNACTIHSVQGGEAKTVILSPSISSRTAPKTFDWLKNHPEIANVAVTRAKEKLVVFADSGAISKLSDTGDNAWNELVHYAKNNGNVVVVPPPVTTPDIGKSNGSMNEEEFFKTMGQLCSIYHNYKLRRNVKVKDVFSDEDELAHCKMEFDSVIYKKAGLFHSEKPIMAFEVNGGEHSRDAKVMYYDRIKQKLCAKKGMVLHIIDNKTVKDYEFMRELISKMNNQEYDQILIDLNADGGYQAKK